MNPIAEKNRKNWDAYAHAYGAHEHTDAKLRKIAENPKSAFDPVTWEMIERAFASLDGVKICVPSSGENLAVFAFALMGARVTSCDISQNQLDNAKRAAEKLGLSGIEFIRTDTMTLEGVPRGAYDFAYTSNGVHVWIDDLNAMYKSIASVLRPGGHYALYEIHPFCRPFDGNSVTEMKVVKPYDLTGPFESEWEVTFGWRLMDILNALLSAGLNLQRFEELQPRINYEDPDWIPHEKKVREGTPRLAREEVDRLYDWRYNPLAALPDRMTAIAVKG